MLSKTYSERLVHVFVISMLGNCGSVLSSGPNKPIRTPKVVQNAAAHLLTGTRKVSAAVGLTEETKDSLIFSLFSSILHTSALLDTNLMCSTESVL